MCFLPYADFFDITGLIELLHASGAVGFVVYDDFKGFVKELL